jgi:hypothetical protein
MTSPAAQSSILAVTSPVAKEMAMPAARGRTHRISSGAIVTSVPQDLHSMRVFVPIRVFFQPCIAVFPQDGQRFISFPSLYAAASARARSVGSASDSLGHATPRRLASARTRRG